jgi:hypothetical protein
LSPESEPDDSFALNYSVQNTNKASRKAFNVTFFSAGKFVEPLIDNGIWNAAEKITSRDWRICSQAQLFAGAQSEKGKWGYYSKGGPNWVYDDTNGTHNPARLESAGIAYCAVGAYISSAVNLEGPGKGYVYTAPGHWPKRAPARLHVTRYYAELYTSSEPDPNEFPSGWSHGSPVVNVSLRYPRVAGNVYKYVHSVCKKLTSNAWMSVWSDAPGITKDTFDVIRSALNACSRGK